MTYGLSDFYIAKLKEDETFEAPQRLAKAVKADITPEVAEENFYADDSVSVSLKEFTKGKIKLTADYFTPEMLELLLGQTLTEDGLLFAGENDEPAYVAFGFRAKMPGGRYKYTWLYKVKFKIPSESYETKPSAGFNVIAPEIEGEFFKLEKNGLWAVRHIARPAEEKAKIWFSAVVEPDEAA